jgi:hypothetical protein
MKYKSIMLELIQQRPEMHEQLRKERRLLTSLEIHTKELKESHEAITEQLRQSRPHSDPRQISSEAFEMALKEMEDRLPPASPPGENESLSLDEAMAFIRDPSRSA